jgi:TolB protein
MSFHRYTLLIPTFLIISSLAFGEWTHRYPKVDGQRHHIYLEGYEFPIISSKPKYPAESTDGAYLAFSAHGYIWIMDLKTMSARQLTDTGYVDSRPRWSNDSSKIAFVRDKGTDTSIIVMYLDTKKTVEINTPAIELDPEFSTDDKQVYFSSSQNGQLAIWSYELATASQSQITNLKGHSRNVRFSSDDQHIYFNHLSWPKRQIIALDLSNNSREIINEDSIAGQLSFDIHPNKDIITYNRAINDDLNLITADLKKMELYSNLTPGHFYVQDPSWSHNGKSIYFTEPTVTGDWQLKIIPIDGGSPKNLDVKKWIWKKDRTSVSIKTKKGGNKVASRLSILDSNGHPILNPDGPNYFDSQNGHYYFYSNGEISIDVPRGKISLLASAGLTTLSSKSELDTNLTKDTEINLTEVWSPEKNGYKSADFHLHLNYDGPFRGVLEHIEPLLEGENLDIATPQAANLHSRLMDREFKNQTLQLPSGRLIKFAQEIRSHFHGHIGSVGPSEFYYPWYWGPGYPALIDGNKTNADVISFVNSFPDSIATYVHPIAVNIDPFETNNISNIPIEFLPNAILEKDVGLELVCAWSDEFGTTNLWYRLLNIGKPILAMAGTDMFVDFQRTPAIGSARIYAKHKSKNVNWSDYIEAVKNGASFVTNGPMIEFKLNKTIEHGDIVESGEQQYTLKVFSSVPVDKVEIIINGTSVKEFAGINKGENKTFSGLLDIPVGGWIAARATGGKAMWPSMDSYSFAHTSPIWINFVGSTEPNAKRVATEELTFAMNELKNIAQERYKGENITALLEQFEKAKDSLKN